MNSSAGNQHSQKGAISGRVLDEVQHIVLEVLRNQQTTIYLFGSWAQGQATSHSDIDIAVEPHRPLPAGMLANLRDRLEESHIPYRVEVVDLSKTDLYFRERVLKEGIRWNV